MVISDNEWNVDDTQEDYAPLDVPPKFRDIGAVEVKMKIHDLWDKYVKEELVLEPDFQRQYVWDLTRASLYLESLILKLPTPPVFLAEEKNDKLMVIDGHQRLETIFRFMQPLLKGPSGESGSEIPYGTLSPITLHALEVLRELNGRGITALSIEEREKFWNIELSVVQLPITANSDMKYILFARLNQGSMSLNNQELRNCLYRGPYNMLIAQLGEDQRFLTLWGRGTPDKRMRHRELVLKLFAFLHRIDKYRIPLRVFLNREMEDNVDNFTADKARRYQQQFNNALLWVERIFGKECFRVFRIGNDHNPIGRWGQRRMDLIYEVEMVGFAQFGDVLNQIWESCDDKEKEYLCLLLRHKLISVMTNDSFVASINEGTTRPESIRARFEPWSRVLQSIVAEPNEAIVDGEMLSNSTTEVDFCPRCTYPLTPDDAVWLSIGGETELVHRFCKDYDMP